MLTAAIPKLPFIDKNETIDYYIDKLGFQLITDYGDYFLIENGPIEIHFFHFPILNPGKSDFMIYFRVDREIDVLYDDYRMKGITIHPTGGLEEKPWRQKEFSLLDPSGTLLTFGQAY